MEGCSEPAISHNIRAPDNPVSSYRTSLERVHYLIPDYLPQT